MKPILFNTEMIRAILDGRKTVTRRVVKPQHLRVLDSPYHKEHPDVPDKVLLARLCEPPYRPDDILYVRETFRIDYLSNIIGTGRVHYKADGSFADIRFAPNRYDMMRRAQLKPGWRPNENMPREAARIWLRVTDVRVERLQDSFTKHGGTIFEIRAEGTNIPEECRDCIDAYGSPCCIDTTEDDGSECGMLDYPRSDFADLWDSTIKPAERERYGWAANPWVWVIAFEQCEKPEGRSGTDECV